MMALTEGVCPPQCILSENQPIVTVSASAKSITNPDGTAQITTKVTGTITWTPLGNANAIVRQFAETFTDGFTGSGVPTVVYTLGTPVVGLRKVNCCSNFAKQVVINQAITITPTFPA